MLLYKASGKELSFGFSLSFVPTYPDCYCLIGDSFDVTVVAKDFEDKDRCYIYKEPSIPFDPLCNDADYIVDGSPLITLNEAEVNLTRISGD